MCHFFLDLRLVNARDFAHHQYDKNVPKKKAALKMKMKSKMRMTSKLKMNPRMKTTSKKLMGKKNKMTFK